MHGAVGAVARCRGKLADILNQQKLRLTRPTASRVLWRISLCFGLHLSQKKFWWFRKTLRNGKMTLTPHAAEYCRAYHESVSNQEGSIGAAGCELS